ncbi:uncharacterized protein SPSC_03450 [Sporisorium scitamineum]|uniref:Uncharacterized protein n=1 Tax=Sporisorium scitamineum TaxID=49012 RepID=A0A0F7SC35_9BASI|nr:uncharacterized protein SPSC_03450 [Sporisorium scitamineum]CDW98328.1 hypothetical protein [Sporisorium scitamineum]
MADAATLDAIIQDYIDRNAATDGTFEFTLITLRHLSSHWLSNNPDLNRSLLDSVLNSSLFQQLIPLLVTQHSHLVDGLLRRQLHHRVHSGAYDRFDAAIRPCYPDNDHAHAAAPASPSPNQLIRLLLESAFDQVPSQPHPEDPPLPENDDHTKMLVRSSFALPFRGPAVELLLAHIRIHELGNRRVAALRRARMHQARLDQDAARLMHVEMRQDNSQTDTSSSASASVQFGATATAPAPAPQDQTVVADQEMQQLSSDVDGDTSASSSSLASLTRSVVSVASGAALGDGRLQSPPAGSAASQDSVEAAASLVDTELYYAKVLPIIQSSGFGKSKLCVHLSTAQPGMLVCMRPEPRVPVSFPPQDASVYKYFSSCYEQHLSDPEKAKALTITQSNLVHTIVSSFLAAYCYELHYTLSQLMHISGCFPHFDPLHHAPQSCWNTVVFSLATSLHSKPDFLADLKLDPPYDLCPLSRLASYGLLGLHSTPLSPQSAQTLPPQDQGFIRELLSQRARADLLERICKRAALYLEQYKPNKHKDGYKTPLAQHLTPALAQLEALMPHGSPESGIFFLALDECNTFQRMLPHIRRVWNAARPKRTWLLLIDTNSRVAPMVGAEAREASKRTMKKLARLVHPFVDMPLDVNFVPEKRKKLHDDILKNKCTLLDLNRLLPLLGRPLWNDAIYSDRNHIIEPESVFMKLVEPDTWKWPAPDDSNHNSDSKTDFANIMALLSQRSPLEHSTETHKSQWNKFVRRQVSQHLRFLCNHHQDTDVLDTHIPSEPALSLAVTWSFRHEPELTAHKWSLAVSAIASAQDKIGLNVGLQGEEGVRVLCHMAADLAASARHRSLLVASKPHYIALMGVVTLHDWLECLIGSFDRTSDTFDSKFRDWSRRQWLNFKHVADLEHQIKGEVSMPIDVLGEFWMRHAAIRGVSNQCGWDLLLPIYESDEPPVGKQVFSMHKLSYVALQVKNCASKPSPPQVIGPSLPDLLENSQSRVSLEMFLDLRSKADATLSWSTFKHTHSGFHQVHRVSVFGSSTRTFPLLAQLNTKARDKIPLLFGLASMFTDDFEIDMTEFSRSCEQAPLLSYLRSAQIVKEGKLNQTTSIPSTDEILLTRNPGRRLRSTGKTSAS